MLKTATQAFAKANKLTFQHNQKLCFNRAFFIASQLYDRSKNMSAIREKCKTRPRSRPLLFQSFFGESVITQGENMRHGWAILVFTTLVACGGGSGAAGTSTPAPVSASPPPPPVTAPATSTAGCGSGSKLTTGMHSLTSDGIKRSYWVEMPASYDRNKTYPVIIGLHWRDGSAADVYGWSGFFGLKNLYGDNAIFLAPDGLDKGWANTGDRDIRFMRAMISEVQQGACTDPQRVFATGFSFGGMMSNAIGCQMGDVVRAIVPMSGSLWSGCASSSYKVAAMFIHAKDDNTVPYSAGMEARDVFLKRNSCSATTVPVGNNGCVEYQGCDSDKPVIWCGTETGGHWYPNFSAQESKAFFDRFK